MDELEFHCMGAYVSTSGEIWNLNCNKHAGVVQTIAHSNSLLQLNVLHALLPIHPPCVFLFWKGGGWWSIAEILRSHSKDQVCLQILIVFNHMQIRINLELVKCESEVGWTLCFSLPREHIQLLCFSFQLFQSVNIVRYWGTLFMWVALVILQIQSVCQCICVCVCVRVCVRSFRRFAPSLV